MTSRPPSTSSSLSSTHTAPSSTTSSLLSELHPLPTPSSSSSIPLPTFSLSDIVFIVGEGNSSREMCEIVDIGYKASDQCYVYDCVPLYNPALQGLFLCRDRDLRKSKFGVGERVSCASSSGGVVTVLDVKYLDGRFCYRVGKGKGKCRGASWEESSGGGGAGEELIQLLEEADLVKLVEGRSKENERP